MIEEGKVLSTQPNVPLQVCYGIGDDSTALLEGLYALGIRPDVITFGNTGSERVSTMAYLPIVNERLRSIGFPEVTVCTYQPKDFKYYPPYSSLYENCLTNGTLPSLAFSGRKNCSLKWKVAPQNKFMENWAPAKECWARGERVMKLIGYEAGEEYRSDKAEAKLQQQKAAGGMAGLKADAVLYEIRYPLIEWGWTREICQQKMIEAGVAPPGKSACPFCLTGETEVLTRQGLKPIRELVGYQDLLIPIRNGHYKTGAHGGKEFQTSGSWQTCEIRDFGVQRVWQVNIHRGQTKKTIRCTDKHRWVLADGSVTFTQDLVAGSKLRRCVPVKLSCAGSPITPSAFGIAQGFVYGDGTAGNGDRPGLVVFHGDKDKAMLPWFSTCEIGKCKTPQGQMPEARNLPKFWKRLPPLEESKSFLLGWFAGYFAADGHMDKKRAAAIESASEASLRFVRDVCHLLGVRCSEVKPREREGFNGWETLYRLTFCAGDLPDSFWLLDAHKSLVKGHKFKPELRRDWIVDSVVETAEEEPVYCAVVPGIEQFTLADELVTGNCPATKPYELHELAREDLLKIVTMEIRAKPRLNGWKTQQQLDEEYAAAYEVVFLPKLQKWERDVARGKFASTAVAEKNRPVEPKRYKEGEGCKGLWNQGCKGTRGGVKKPGMMTEYIKEHALLPVSEIEFLENTVPLALTGHLDAFRESLQEDGRPREEVEATTASWKEFLAALYVQSEINEQVGACEGCGVGS